MRIAYLCRDFQTNGRSIDARELSRALRNLGHDLVIANTCEQLRSTDHVIAVSPALARSAVRNGVEPERVTVLPSAVDVRRFEAGDRQRYLARAKLELAGRQVVGFAEALGPWHDTAALVRAVGLLRRHGAPVHLLVIGDRPDRTRLEALAGDEALSGAATFMGDVPHDELPAYLAALDVAVVPSAADGRCASPPLALLEYLAAARPVVAADARGIRHCVRPGRTGLLCRPGDIGGLVRAIAVLLRDPVRAGRLGAAGREHVRSFHGWDRTARSILELARPATETACALAKSESPTYA